KMPQTWRSCTPLKGDQSGGSGGRGGSGGIWTGSAGSWTGGTGTGGGATGTWGSSTAGGAGASGICVDEPPPDGAWVAACAVWVVAGRAARRAGWARWRVGARFARAGATAFWICFACVAAGGVAGRYVGVGLAIAITPEAVAPTTTSAVAAL